MASSSITSVKALNPRHLCSVIPGAPGYLAIAWSQVPKKWLRSGHFLAPQTGPGAAENLVLPLYRMVVQHMKNQILTEVTAELVGAVWSVMRCPSDEALGSKSAR
jgi:hypothetical protein